MPYFKKKPVIIEAVQWIGSNILEIQEFMFNNSPIWSEDEFDNIKLIIPTLEGDHKANINDWIIKGIQGEFYPCKPDIFKETYELIEE